VIHFKTKSAVGVPGRKERGGEMNSRPYEHSQEDTVGVAFMRPVGVSAPRWVSAFEQIIEQIHHVARADRAVTVAVPGSERIRGGTASEEIVYQIDHIARVNHHVPVDVS
jgi:hypothetical protein